MKKSTSIFLLKFSFGCGLAFFHIFADAVQIGDRIEIPVQERVYLDDGSNCENYASFKASNCTIGYGDAVEVLGIKDLGKSVNALLVLKYLPGNNHWEGKCQPSVQNFCFVSSAEMELYKSYSVLKPKIESVTESEEPSEKFLEDHNSTAVVKGQIFSVYESFISRHFPNDIISRAFWSSWESIRFNGFRFIGQGDCSFYYGYRLKVVGFHNSYSAYARLMEPEYEKQVVEYRQFYNCPLKELFLVPIPNLVRNEVLYRESLKLREDFLKALISSRLKSNLFDSPLTVDGLTVGQEAWVPSNRRASSIMNIDFEYLEQWEDSLRQSKHSFQKESEEVISLLEDLNSRLFMTIPMMKWWCKSNILSQEEVEYLHYGRIIGFTEIDSGLPRAFADYRGSSKWFAIVEEDFFNTDSLDFEDLSCKFTLIPTSELLSD